MHHVVHMCMHPSPLSLSDSDVNFHYSVCSDCYILISWPVSDKNELYSGGDSRWWAPWLSVHVFSHFRTISGWSRDCITCHRHHMTYPNLCRSVVMISTHLQWFPMIFSFGRCLALIVNPGLVPHGTAEVLQFSKTVAENTSMLGYQNSEAVSAYCFSLTLIWQFGDIVIVAQGRNRCYELDMVILKVGLLPEPPVLCTSGKIYQLSSFSF